MSNTKRIRSDSVNSALNAINNAAKPLLLLPSFVSITDSAKPYWECVIASRARDEWALVDLIVAAQLSQCQADMAEEDALLRSEGKVIENQRGTPVMNPRTAVMDQLARREMALMRTLRMGGQALGNVRDKVGARKMERDATKLRDEIEDDDLLAS